MLDVMERREFIPVGACVEEPTAALFEAPETSEAAAEACLSCVQLENCTKQQIAIASLIANRQNPRPVVAAEATVPLPVAHSTVARHMELSEPTFKFSFKPLPSDGIHGLRAIQQATRTGQLYTSTKLAIDMLALYGSQLAEADPSQHAFAETQPHLVPLIGNLILASIAPRRSNGRIRYAKNWQPESLLKIHYPIVRQFLMEAEETQRLGIKPERAVHHSPAFFEELLRVGRTYDLSGALLRTKANKGITDLIPTVQRDIEVKRRRDKRYKLLKSQRPLTEVDFDANDKSKIIAELVYCNVFEVLDTGKLRLHKRVQYLDDNERSAIIHAFDLASLREPEKGRRKTEATIGMPCKALVQQVVLPYMCPDIRAAAQVSKKASLDPLLLLALVRRGLSIGVLSIDSRTASDREYLRHEFPYDIQTHSLARQPAALTGLTMLYRRTARLLAYGEEGLSMPLFRSVAAHYLADVDYLKKRGYRLAPRMALYFSSDTHDATIRYLASKSDLRPNHIATSMTRCAAPLKFANTYLAVRQRILRNIPSDQGLSESTISTMAQRNMSVGEARKLVQLTKAYQAEFGDIFSDSNITSFCLRYDVSLPHQVREIIAFKAGIARDVREKYGSHRKYSAEIQQDILKAKRGAEIKVLQKFLAQRGIRAVE